MAERRRGEMARGKKKEEKEEGGKWKVAEPRLEDWG
jgi:hypothetical protein